jgi:hypothetical protein
MRKPVPTFASMALAASALAAAPTSARAQETAGAAPGAFAPVAAPGGGFGAPGQWVISGGAAAVEVNGASASFHTHSGGSGLTLHPAADYFLAPNISVGGVVGFTYDSGGTTIVELGGRAGFDLVINDRVTVWLMGGVSVARASVNHMSSTPSQLTIFAPFLYHVAPHLFAGLGPSLFIGMSGGTDNSFGIDSIIGGWF